MNKQTIFITTAVLLLSIAAVFSFFNFKKSKPKNNAQNAALELQKNLADVPYHINLSDLPNNVTINSTLQVRLKKNGEQSINKEEISFSSLNGLIHFKKSIDPYHFFELIKADDAVAIKNSNGPWRLLMENHKRYDDLIINDINGLSFIFAEFGLTKARVKTTQDSAQNNIVSIFGNVTLPKAYHDEENDNKQLKVLGEIILSKDKNLPLQAEISLLWQDEKNLNNEFSLDYKMNTQFNNAQKIAFPKTAPDFSDEQVVNVSTKFLELMKNFKN